MHRSTSRGGGTRLRRLAAVAVAGLLLLLVVRTASGWTGAGAVLYSVLAVGALALVVVGALRQRAGRAPWLLLATGAGILISGQLSLMWLVEGYDPAGTPAIWLRGLEGRPGAFAAGLVAYPLLYAAQMQLLRRRVERLLPSAWLDGAVTAAVLAAVSWAFVVPAAGRSLGLGTVGALLLSARPLLDLLLLSLAVASCALAGWRADRRLLLVLAAFAVLCAGDTAGALDVAGVLTGAGVGLAADVARLVALLLVAAAAVSPPSPVVEPRGETLAVVVTPVLALGACVGLLLLDGTRPLPAGAVGLLLATLVLVGLKLLLVIREVVALAGSRRLALTDDLTGLGNRRSLDAELRAALAAEGPVALLLLDLDRFKEVNDRHGHATGDALLRRVGDRLVRVLPPTTHLVRLGGDEFAAVLPGAGPEGATAVARAVVAAVAEPFDVGGRVLGAGTSVGVATSPDAAGRTLDPVEVLRRADVAMYLAKRGGAGTEPGAPGVYDEDVDGRLRARAQLLDELRAALGRDRGPDGSGEVVVHYQPQVATTGEVVGAEALVRWHHPRHGILAPGAFLDLVEEHGLMAEVTTRVLRQAVQDAVRWRGRGHRLRVSVNLSTSCLVNPDLLPLVDGVLAQSGLAPGDLVLEITETTLMHDPEQAVRTTRSLRERGVGLSIDDYGTGYASMTYLDDLPATELKLDRSFTAHLLERPRTAAIVRTTVDLAHRLGMRLVAEGVEDEATLQALHELGCDETQGYLHSRPLAAPDLERWLVARRTAPPLPRPRRRTPQTSSR